MSCATILQFTKSSSTGESRTRRQLSEFAMAGKEIWLALVLGVPLLLFAWVYNYSLQLQRIRKVAAKVPPGNFWQLPVLGETFQVLTDCADDFVLPRMSKYGATFRTHLLGSPCICTTTAGAAKFILQFPHMFKARYSSSTRLVFGKDAINEAQGELHSRYRKIIQTPIISGALRNFIDKIDLHARRFWKERGDKGNVTCYEHFATFAFQVILLICLEDFKLGSEASKFAQLFSCFQAGFLSIPNNLPGTVCQRAFKARRTLQGILLQLIQERRQELGSSVHEDMLDALLYSSGPDGSKLTDNQIADNILFVLEARHETVTSTMVCAVRNLCLYPKVLELVKAENDGLARRRKHVDDPITWDELQELTLTTQLLQETMKISNVIPFTFREATEDVIYNGMLFPKGWAIIVWFRYFHLDPELFTNPQEFRLERFETKPKPNTYTPFGNGNRACPGRELAMAEMLIFMHWLLVTYDFEVMGDLQKTQQWPMPHPKDGWPFLITERASRYPPHPDRAVVSTAEVATHVSVRAGASVT